MSNEVNNPYKIESELTEMIKDVKQYYHNNSVWEQSILPAEKFEDLMKSKYEYLYKSSEGLFTKCLKNEFREKRNLTRIEEMLKHLKNIYNGRVNRETVDKQLGAKYAKEYVEPLINKDKK
jgi:hypoxanthine phosphoribosyltransferase